MHSSSRKRSHTSAFGSKPVIYASTAILAISSLQHVIQAQSLPGLRMGVPERDKRDNGNTSLPIIIYNNCTEQICPGVNTQGGQGPSTSGFCLHPGGNQTLFVSSNWQGRVWGRTNCSFPNQGAPNSACLTGDCAGALECTLAGQPPVTLAEFTFEGANAQSFYDISIVDGFNIGVAIESIANRVSQLQNIPPNKTNPSCVGSVADFSPNFNPYKSSGNNSGNSSYFLGTNSTWPLPFLTKLTKQQLSQWCPWDLQVFPPKKPGNGVYPYPDDNIQRPIFQPCWSTCAKYNAPKDCCTGQYNSPSACKPGLYSQQAKSVCPDAYTYAYDDSASTFTVPSGGGFQVTFCPAGVSTNIIATVQAAQSKLKSGAYWALGEIPWVYAVIVPLAVTGILGIL